MYLSNSSSEKDVAVIINSAANVGANTLAHTAITALNNSASITVVSTNNTHSVTQQVSANASAIKSTSDMELQPASTDASAKGAKRASGQTGPKSLAGKKKIRFNALKQGRYAKSPVLPFEDAKLYDKHSKSVFAALAPTNYIETQMVDEYANALWRIYRHEARSVYEREQILNRLTPQMAAQMLGMADERAHRAPQYLTQLDYKVSKAECQSAQKGLKQYEHLLKNAKGIANFNLVWRQYPELFEALAVWIDSHFSDVPLFNATHQGLSLGWQQHPAKVLECLDKLSDELYYIAHWEEMKPKIRVWMETYYFLQRTEQYRINQDEQLLMKERNYAHTLLDRLARLRKSGILVHSTSLTGGE